MAGGGSRTSWFVGDGEGRSSPWLVVVACEWDCRRGRSLLFVLVVSRGVRVVDGGGRLWAVVEFVAVGGDVVGARCCWCWSRGGVSRGARVVACGHLWAVVVVVVTGWRWWWAVAVVGDGRCVCTGRGAWSSFVVHSLFRGRCGRLWPFLFVGVVVCGRCLWSSPSAVWAVVVGRRVS